MELVRRPFVSLGNDNVQELFIAKVTHFTDYIATGIVDPDLRTDVALVVSDNGVDIATRSQEVLHVRSFDVSLVIK